MSGEIPTFDRAELEGLQLERLPRHAARGVRARAALHARLRRGRRDARRPDLARPTSPGSRSPTKADLRANYPFGMFAVPREQVSRVHASSGTTGKPTVVGYTREDLDTWSELMARSIRAAGGRPGRRRARRLRLRAVHRRARCPLRRRAARLHGGPGQRRDDRAAGAADRRLPAADHHGDAVVLPGDPRRARGAGRRPEGHQPRDRHLRRRAVDRRDAARGRGADRPHGPSTSTGSRR